MKRIEWPEEDVVIEICWNGDPDRCEVIPREFLPDPVCEYCMKYNGEACTKCWNNNDESEYFPERDDRDPDDTCDEWEWDENEENLREEPLEPRREDYRTERAYRMAKKAVREWWMQERGDRDD